VICGAILVLVPRFGTFGASAAYVFGAGAVGLPWAAVIFGKARRTRGADPAVLTETLSADG
jgi:O-antigen/teichoic acid export membrane protein